MPRSLADTRQLWNGESCRSTSYPVHRVQMMLPSEFSSSAAHGRRKRKSDARSRTRVDWYCCESFHSPKVDRKQALLRRWFWRLYSGRVPLHTRHRKHLRASPTMREAGNASKGFFRLSQCLGQIMSVPPHGVWLTCVRLLQTLPSERRSHNALQGLRAKTEVDQIRLLRCGELAFMSRLGTATTV